VSHLLHPHIFTYNYTSHLHSQSHTLLIPIYSINTHHVHVHIHYIHACTHTPSVYTYILHTHNTHTHTGWQSMYKFIHIIYTSNMKKYTLLLEMYTFNITYIYKYTHILLVLYNCCSKKLQQTWYLQIIYMNNIIFIYKYCICKNINSFSNVHYNEHCILINNKQINTYI